MKRTITVPLRRLYWNFIGVILGVELISEFAVHRGLKSLGMNPEFLSANLLELLLTTFTATTLVVLFALKWRQKWIGEVQQRLLESQENYRSLFDQNPYAVYSCDFDGQITSLNLSFQNMTGYKLEDLEGLPSFSPVVAGEKARLKECFQKVLQGKSEQIETIFMTKDGQLLDVNVMYLPIYRETEIVGVYSIAQNITRQKIAERELRNLQEMFSSLFNNTSDALMVFKPDRTVLHVNRAFEKTYGWTAEEMLGRPIPAIAAQDRLEEVDQMIRTILSGQVVSSTETVRLCKDGSSLDVNVTVAPIRDGDGQVVAIAGISRDITKHKKMARELAEAKQRFESLIQNTADAISLVDMDGNLQMVNPAWEHLYGWKAEEVLGKKSPNIEDWNNPVFVHEVNQIQTGNVLKKETIRKRRNGEDVEVSLTGSPVFAFDGSLEAFAIIAKDLTEFRKTEEFMLQSAKLALAGELAAGIAHEIRNPLTAIQGYLQLMRTHFDPSYLDVLLPEVERINEIIGEFLLVSKPQHTRHQAVDLREIVQDVVTLMESEAHMYTIALNTKLLDDLPPIICVKNQIKQVFLNLVKNAIEAMPNGGNIVLEMTGDDDGVLVTVADDGPGIPPERLQKLGEPFYTTKERGTGLGLMVTYRIVQNHEGKIQVKSEVGEGTKFEIYFPFHRSQPFIIPNS